jgi:PRTRC genetic system protein A
MSLDEAILRNFPLLAAPHDAGITSAQTPGVRYVVGKNGLWRDIQKSWLRAITPVAITATAVIPYGTVMQKVEFLCAMPPAKLWREFADLAKAMLPNEVAAAMVWHTVEGTWRLAARKSLQARSDYVEYSEVELQEGEELVVDIHSHGKHPAYFSGTDDRDDHGSIKVSAVFGCVGTEAMEIAARLMLIDKTIELQITPAGGWITKEN